jgi:two-component system, chemotaxis family, protein-glutamate methylesterase/glutaminase
MERRDIVVVGASAGGVETLKILASGLPADFPAAVFVALHISPRTRSFLPYILSNSGPLPAVHPADGATVELGKIYVAPPNHHLLIEADHVHLSSGPKENAHRPAVNALFRSAAVSYGSRVIGVVLSGNLDDGTAGLWEIKRRGGLAIVQDPHEALYSGMPANALTGAKVDFSLPIREIAPKLVELVAEAGLQKTSELSDDMSVKPTSVTCPECRGPLEEIRQGPILEFRCRIGHAYSPEALVNAHEDTIERTLWAAVVALEEGIEMSRLLRDSNTEEFRRRRMRQEMAKEIRNIIGRLDASSTLQAKTNP